MDRESFDQHERMSQSRIPLSYALYHQDVDITNVSQNTLPRVVPIRSNEEPDCEIIRIENEEEVEHQQEKASSELSNGSASIEVKTQSSPRVRSVQRIKPIVVRSQQSDRDSQSNIVSPVSTTLPLSLIADSLNKIKALSGNKRNQHRMLMVVPVNAATPVIFGSPTLCKLRTIDKSAEVPCTKQVTGIQQMINDTKIPNGRPTIQTLRMKPKSINRTNKKILGKAILSNRTECRSRMKLLSPLEKTCNSDVFFMGKKVGEKISILKSKKSVNNVASRSQASSQSILKKSINNIVSLSNEKMECPAQKDAIGQHNLDNTDSSLCVDKKVVANISSEKTNSILSIPTQSINDTFVKNRKNIAASTELTNTLISNNVEKVISASKQLMSDIRSESQQNILTVPQESIKKVVTENRKSLFSTRKEMIVNTGSEKKKSLFSIPKESTVKNTSENKKSLFSLLKEPVITVASENLTCELKDPITKITSGKDNYQLPISEESIIHVISGDENNFISEPDEYVINVSSETHNRVVPAAKESIINFNSEDRDSYILLPDFAINVPSENFNRLISLSNEQIINIDSLNQDLNEDSLISVSKIPVDNITCLRDQNNSLSFLTDSITDDSSSANKSNAISIIENPKRLNSFVSQKRSVFTSTETTDSSIYCSLSQNISDCNDNINYNRIQKNLKSSVTSQWTQTQNIDTELTKTDVPAKKKKITLPIKKSHESLSNNEMPASTWKSQCVVCKNRFTDRYELHKHATLIHPQVQMVFCEYCSDSFLTERDLKEHRVFIHNQKIEQTDYSAPDNTLNQQNSPELSKKSSKRKIPNQDKKISNCNYVDEEVIRHSTAMVKEDFESAEIRKLIVRVTKLDEPVLTKYLEKHAKKPVIVCDMKKGKKSGHLGKNGESVATSSEQSTSMEKVRRGNRIKRPSTKKLLREEYEEIRMNLKRQGKRKDQHWTFKHDTDVHTDELPSSSSSSSGFSQSIEIMTSQSRATDEDTEEIIVDDLPSDCDQQDYQIDDKKSVIDSNDYCQKDIDNSVTKITFDEPIDKNIEESLQKTESSIIEQQKDQNDEAVVKERQVIRKLTSKSSAASVVTLEFNRRSRECFNIPGNIMSDTPSEKELSDDGDAESNCSSTGEINRESRKERSMKQKLIQESKNDETSKTNGESTRDGNYNEFSDYESENGEREEENKGNTCQRTTMGTSSNSKKFESPVELVFLSQGERQSEIVDQLKKQWNDTNSVTTEDLCSICNELFTLMKKLAPQFEGNEGRKNPVQCPFCTLFFIVEFYLEEHIADKHLHCENQRSCKEIKVCGSSRYGTTEIADLKCDSNMLDLAFECRNCLMKFDTEKNLNDHTVANHNTQIPSKESFVTGTPEYLNKLPSFCFESSCEENMMDTPLQSPESFTDSKLILDDFGVQSGDKVTSLIKSIEDGEESEVCGEKVERISNHDCSLCEATFVKRSEYIRHVRKLHNPLKLSSEAKNNKSSPELWVDYEASSSDESCISETERSPIVAAMDTNLDQTTADREYLLKQLLSDDSMDCFDDEDNKTVKKDNALLYDCTKEINDNVLDQDSTKVPETKIIGNLSILHSCKICLKSFSTAQDLLVHNLHHEHEISGSNANFSAVAQTEMRSHYQELFSDPLLDDCRMEFESIAPSSMMSIEAECEAARKLSYRMHSDQDSSPEEEIFADYNKSESEDTPVTTVQSNNKIVVCTKRQGSFLSHPESEKRSRPQNIVEESRSRKDIDGKKPRAYKRKSTKPDVSYQNEKRDAIKELLETEKGIVNPDAKTVSDKVPIECDKCNRKFANQTALNEHLFFLHDDSLKDKVLTDVMNPMSRLKGTDESNKGWRCSGCSQHFKLQQTYSRHRYFMHGDESMVHVCENCCKVLTTVTMVNVHICMDVASYNCRTCNETFPTGMSLRLHNTEKHIATPGPHVCQPCNKNFLTKAMMDRHTKWKHRFFRPYRPRKTSPVRMATCKHVNVQKSSGKLYEDNESELDIRLTNSEFPEQSSDLGTHMDSDPSIIQSRVENSQNLKKLRKREIVADAGSKGNLKDRRKDTITDTESLESTKILLNRSKKSVTYLDEREIFQCNFCNLYCLSKEALRNHMQKSLQNHSSLVEVCQLCRKSYTKGKMVRHMIDNHVIPSETYEMESYSIWKNTKDTSEKDAEMFIKMLGIQRFMSLCEYQRFTELTNDAPITCPSCQHRLQSCELYREHFFSHHDTMCALCDIEFRSGKDAAKHKVQAHNTVESYLWFATGTVSAVTSSRNFNEVTERCFIEMLSHEIEDTSTEESISEDDTEQDTTTEEQEIRIQENESHSQVEEKLIVVVNDKDLKEYNIGTRYPNIWGLAAKISSTSRDLTPKDVKEMLESHFERNDESYT